MSFEAFCAAANAKDEARRKPTTGLPKFQQYCVGIRRVIGARNYDPNSDCDEDFRTETFREFQAVQDEAQMALDDGRYEDFLRLWNQSRFFSPLINGLANISWKNTWRYRLGLQPKTGFAIHAKCKDIHTFVKAAELQHSPLLTALSPCYTSKLIPVDQSRISDDTISSKTGEEYFMWLKPSPIFSWKQSQTSITSLWAFHHIMGQEIVRSHRMQSNH